MMREWKDPQGTAARCLACLSSRVPRLRLTAARALETIADPAALGAFVVGPRQRPRRRARLEDPRGDGGRPGRAARPRRSRCSGPARRCSCATSTRRSRPPGTRRGRCTQARYAAEIAALRGRAKATKPAPLQYGPEQLRELAFGAYVGLVREQGGAEAQGPGRRRPEAIRVRQTALGRILALAKDDPRHAGAARPVFVQALGDPNQAVRFQAFEHLQALGMDADGAGGRGAGHRAHRPGRQGAGAADRRRLGRGGAGRPRAGRC